jgi:hypothetical protein
LLFGSAKPALAGVKASIDRNLVPVNQSFELLFSVDYTPDHDPDFSPLQRHFTILGMNRGSSFSLIDGNYRRSIEWTLQLMPKQVGEFVIPAIRIEQERSQPVPITVEPSTLLSVPQDELALDLLADVAEVYVQGQVVLTLRLLSANDVTAYEFGEVKVDSLDVVIEPMGGERQYQARIADRLYLVRERQYALFPQQSGRLEVGPIMAEAEARYDPFGTGDSRRIRSRPLVLEVRPIPADYRAAYWLPTTRLELREDWSVDPSALVTGEPVTRSLTLQADGLTAAQLPQLELGAIDGIKQYPEQPGLENSRRHDGIRSRREQKVELIAAAAGVYRVPALRLPWWNLETGKMEVAFLPARELTVAPAAGVALPPVVAGTEGENLAVAPAPAAAAGNRLWLWSSLLLGCGWAASGFYWWNRSRRANVPTEKESLKSARRRLHDSCAANDAAAARCALLAWGRALLAPREVSNLHQLNEVFDGSLLREIEALDRSLYAKDHAAWRGGELADLCRRLERAQPVPRREQAGLMPLNPAG